MASKLSLTPRDRDVLRLGAMGLSDKAIADKLELSYHTVHLYFVRLREKLGSFDRAMLPGIALLLRIVSISDITMGALEFLQDRTLSFGTDKDGAREPAD